MDEKMVLSIIKSLPRKKIHLFEGMFIDVIDLENIPDLDAIKKAKEEKAKAEADAAKVAEELIKAEKEAKLEAEAKLKAEEEAKLEVEKLEKVKAEEIEKLKAKLLELGG